MQICYQRVDQPHLKANTALEGINSMPMLEPQNTCFLLAVCIPGVHDEGTELTPSQLAVTLGVGAAPLLVAQECNLSVVLP
jgi:hypothetical protein